MYYRLKDDFELCSYKGCPYGIYNRKFNKTDFIHDRDCYLLLYKCNGNVDFDTLKLTDEQSKFMEMACKEALDVSLHPNPMPHPIPSHIYPNEYRQSIHWSITGNCNFKCKHCFQSACDGLGEPTFEQIEELVRQMKEAGIFDVSITGGEPLVRKDFFDIVDLCKDNGIRISTIYSNGWLIDDKFISELKKHDINPAFQISFDGIGYHDWMRGREGAEEKAISAIKKLVSNGYHVGSAFALCKENASSMRETIRFLESIGISAFKVQRCMPQGKWIGQKEHFLTDEELLKFYLEYIQQYKDDNLHIPVQVEGVYMLSRDKENQEFSATPLYDMNLDEHQLESRFSCAIMLDSFYLNFNGAVVPCMNMAGTKLEEQFPNAFDIPLPELLCDSSYTKLCRVHFKDVVNKNEECRNCDHILHCAGGKCRAIPIGLEDSDLCCKDGFLCNFYEKGWNERFDKLMSKKINSEQLDNVEC